MKNQWDILRENFDVNNEADVEIILTHFGTRRLITGIIKSVGKKSVLKQLKSIELTS